MVYGFLWSEKEGIMRSRPTWTRYGNGIVMMHRPPAQYRREEEKTGAVQVPIFSDLPPEPAVDEGEGEPRRPALIAGRGKQGWQGWGHGKDGVRLPS